MCVPACFFACVYVSKNVRVVSLLIDLLRVHVCECAPLWVWMCAASSAVFDIYMVIDVRRVQCAPLLHPLSNSHSLISRNIMEGFFHAEKNRKILSFHEFNQDCRRSYRVENFPEKDKWKGKGILLRVWMNMYVYMCTERTKLTLTKLEPCRPKKAKIPLHVWPSYLQNSLCHQTCHHFLFWLYCQTKPFLTGHRYSMIFCYHFISIFTAQGSLHETQCFFMKYV